MGVPVIIGLVRVGNTRQTNRGALHAPNPGILENLAQLIYSTFPHRGVIINGFGEALGPSKDRVWTPQAVADWVKAGNVWIDYCGWPMYQTVSATGVVGLLSGSGFQQFAQAVGYPTLSRATFDVAPGTNYGFGGGPHYVFPRGLRLQGSLDGIYINTGFFLERAFKPMDVFGPSSWPITASGYTANFALQPAPPNGGLYFYATFVPPGLFEYFKSVPNYIPEAVYAEFIQEVVAGHVNQDSSIQYIPLTGIHSQYHPTPPKKQVPTYNSQGNLGCQSGWHWDASQKACVLDSPGTLHHMPPKSSGSSGSSGGKATPSPKPKTAATPWYDTPAARVGGVLVGGGLATYGTIKLLQAHERRS